MPDNTEILLIPGDGIGPEIVSNGLRGFTSILIRGFEREVEPLIRLVKPVS